jgi:hypothetical protein
VDDDAFWEGVAPLAFGSLPHLQDAVAVVGYPIGGDTISVTSGAIPDATMRLGVKLRIPWRHARLS